MDRTGAHAYVFAKACGIFSRSFVAERSRRLFEARRMQDLWALLFREEIPLVPEAMLAHLLERRAEQRLVDDFLVLLKAFDVPDPVSLALLSRFDFTNLKAVSSALAIGEGEKPFMPDIGAYSFFEFGKWPVLEAITRNSPVPWYNRVPLPEEKVLWETRLDHEYYHRLYSAVFSLPRQDRLAAESMVTEEIILQNIIWALRLRVYYDMQGSEILPLLAGSGTVEKEADPLCLPAIAILERQMDSWPDWENWKYSWLLNPHEEGVPYLVDPRWAQLSADKYLYKKALKEFRQHPFTSGVLVCFLKIKELELHMIRVAAEGLRLNAADALMQEFMGDDQDA